MWWCEWCIYEPVYIAIMSLPFIAPILDRPPLRRYEEWLYNHRDHHYYCFGAVELLCPVGHKIVYREPIRGTPLHVANAMGMPSQCKNIAPRCHECKRTYRKVCGHCRNDSSCCGPCFFELFPQRVVRAVTDETVHEARRVHGPLDAAALDVLLYPKYFCNCIHCQAWYGDSNSALDQQFLSAPIKFDKDRATAICHEHGAQAAVTAQLTSAEYDQGTGPCARCSERKEARVPADTSAIEDISSPGVGGGGGAAAAPPVTPSFHGRYWDFYREHAPQLRTVPPPGLNNDDMYDWLAENIGAGHELADAFARYAAATSPPSTAPARTPGESVPTMGALDDAMSVDLHF